MSKLIALIGVGNKEIVIKIFQLYQEL